MPTFMDKQTLRDVHTQNTLSVFQRDATNQALQRGIYNVQANITNPGLQQIQLVRCKRLQPMRLVIDAKDNNPSATIGHRRKLIG